MRKLNIILTALLLIAISAWPFAAVSAQGEEPQIRITQVDNSRFPNVTVYVSVTNAAGEPVGVDPATIQISESGQVMQAVNIQGGGEAVGGEIVPVTTMLVIDISGSMDKGNKIGAARDAAKAYISGMREGDQAGLITFDTQVYRVQEVTSDKAVLTAAIDGLKTGSDTAMYDGILEATKALESVSGRKAILVLSDGLDNQSSSVEEDIVTTVGPSGLTISAIGFGEPGVVGQAGIDEAGLKSLTSRTGGQYAYTSDAASLTAKYQQYGEAFQSEYGITYVSPSTLRDGINRRLTVSLANAAVTTEGQYNPGGVLPEVSSRSWSLFAIILTGLLVLLFAPMLFNLGARSLSGFRGKTSSGRSPSKSPQSPARGRIKLSK
ncbi:MAG: vWA domain-containing protein [Anaerolineales bacterium]